MSGQRTFWDSAEVTVTGRGSNSRRWLTYLQMDLHVNVEGRLSM